jgi:starch synthase
MLSARLRLRQVRCAGIVAPARISQPGMATKPQPLRILVAASEVVPYFKSGGLADVARSLPDALVARGHDVRIILPRYSFLGSELDNAQADLSTTIAWTGTNVPVRYHLDQTNSGAPAVLVEQPAFFTTTSPYEDRDPLSPGRRFAFFARAVLEYARAWDANVVHLNDWQCGLLPVYSLTTNVRVPTVFAIHNLAYQGLFPFELLRQIDVPSDYFRTENGLEFYGQLSFIKGGIGLADRIVTVSPSYAREIKTSEYGAGLHGLLTFRERVLNGILNGIDVRMWNPKTDEALFVQYDASCLDQKEWNRTVLLDALELEDVGPLLVVVGRLAHQKGIDIVFRALPQLLELGATLIVLGDGDPALKRAFTRAARHNPRRVAVFFRFDDVLARRLYAAGDFFLMPSRYEPCGLGQMIAQRYGTPPIVRRTGGLIDTVKNGETGFTFEETEPQALIGAVTHARSFWRTSVWDALRQRCMKLEWSWERSAALYEDIYRAAIGPISS